jgi:hypothetical protein
MEHQGGELTHYLLVTDWQLIFWMRGIFSEWLGAGTEADHIDISTLRGLERQQKHGSTILAFHLAFGVKYFVTRSQWSEGLYTVIRPLIRQP